MNIQCDSTSGLCQIRSVDNASSPESKKNVHGITIRYVGDPMCSWCWGISPIVKELETYCRKNGLAFELTVGGLRPGGGDPWNDNFKNFLRGEWQRINQVTGQPFGYTLLDKCYFNYDTEPACRAIVVARELLTINNSAAGALFSFFSSVQHKFYVEGNYPTKVEFYKSICEFQGIPFDEFADNFHSKSAVQRTKQEFDLCRNLGVRGFPSFVFHQDDDTKLLATGYVSFDDLIEHIGTTTRKKEDFSATA